MNKKKWKKPINSRFTAFKHQNFFYHSHSKIKHKILIEQKRFDSLDQKMVIIVWYPKSIIPAVNKI